MSPPSGLHAHTRARRLALLLAGLHVAACTSAPGGRDDSDVESTEAPTDPTPGDAPDAGSSCGDECPDASPGRDAGQADGGVGAADGPTVWVGTPDEATGLHFTALSDGDEIPIRRGGQGGTHALIAIQFAGFGNRVLYQVTLENLDGDGEVTTLPLPRPQPVICEDDGLCRKTPLLVLLGGLAEPADWDGLHVRASATVSNDDGLEASGSVTGFLSYD